MALVFEGAVPALEEMPIRTVGVVQLVAMTFFCVSGGSYGLEDAVRAGYPLLTLVGLLVIPWIWR